MMPCATSSKSFDLPSRFGHRAGRERVTEDAQFHAAGNRIGDDRFTAEAVR